MKWWERINDEVDDDEDGVVVVNVRSWTSREGT